MEDWAAQVRLHVLHHLNQPVLANGTSFLTDGPRFRRDVHALFWPILPVRGPGLCGILNAGSALLKSPSMESSRPEPFEKAVRGDTAALRALLGRYGPLVRRRIRGKIGRQWQSVLDADDVIQVTYLEAFLHIDGLNARDPASFTAWLTRIAENNLHDAIKELERLKRPQPENRLHPQADEDLSVALLELVGRTTTTPSRDAARREASEILESALDRLPADYGRAVRLYDLEGRSSKQVANALGRSVGAVHMLRLRAHNRLRELIGAESRVLSRKA